MIKSFSLSGLQLILETATEDKMKMRAGETLIFMATQARPEFGKTFLLPFFINKGNIVVDI